MKDIKRKEDMNIVIVGHVDHGKSTIIGRLLADTGSLPNGKLEEVKERCRRNSKPFEYAFLLDALKDEQAQGITIDSARCFFQTENREYIIIDAPGHIEFLKNMVTGASRAESALLVIDANEGIQENSKRHGYLLSMLGINQISVLVNKMDLVDYDEKVFQNIVKEYTGFLREINVEPDSFIPISGMIGDNITTKSENTPWYNGNTVINTLDNFQIAETSDDKPFRMPVQDVYKFTKDGDNRRIVAGTIETGKLSVGDEVVFYPSGKRSTVKSIEAFNRKTQNYVTAGYSTGFTLKEQIYITRGEMAGKVGVSNPKVATRIRVNLFWLGRSPMIKGNSYFLKIGNAKVKVEIEKIKRVIDASTLTNVNREQIDRNDVAECILKTQNPIAFDENKHIQNTSRFVIVDDYDISGGGTIEEALEDKQSKVRDQVLLRNYNWEKSMVSSSERAEGYNHKSKLLLITGRKGSGRRDIAKGLEKKLLSTGKKAYYLGVENLIYGIDADIKDPQKEDNREEFIRRFAEIAYILVDAGNILITTIVELSEEELELIKTVVSPENMEIIWIGERTPTDIKTDFYLPDLDGIEDGIIALKEYLQEKNIIMKF
ncbi:GTP-binding protein [Ilyobacter polytropus]|uniref:sulfate adenylyltransferase n=1 Tax=Ilyobacter polytropus (strain ATCC 51220 / DSM 2926 / LMG 16218 / CuHBu1) TaxID=572544 RepID=E3HDY8_ILYPC|nr:GTP-binding protein [Ilyobacter polytropus]ADO84600.1 sulfate adenylyltransferase, large subunit [Ilyobacter polytropus DSM 2926]